MPRPTVAEFYKEPNGRLRLFSLVVTNERNDRGRPYTMRETYDVDWSKRYGYIFEQSGFGGDDAVTVTGPYFVRGAIPVKEQRAHRRARKGNRTRRLRAVPRAFDLSGGQDLLEWLQCHGIEDKAVWCSECDDYHPGDQLCEHCWWCDEIGWYSTPSEPCGCGADCRSQ